MLTFFTSPRVRGITSIVVSGRPRGYIATRRDDVIVRIGGCTAPSLTWLRALADRRFATDAEARAAVTAAAPAPPPCPAPTSDGSPFWWTKY